MQCKEFEAVLEQEGLAPLPLAARSHLADCSACQNLLADLSMIVSSAKGLPAQVNPPERLWVSLHAQMEAEGLIKQPVFTAVGEKSWWQGFSILLRPRVLVTATTGLALAVTVFLVVHRSPVVVSTAKAHGTPGAQVSAAAQPNQSLPSVAAPSAAAPAAQETASLKHASKPVPSTTSTFTPSPSDILYTSTSVALRDAEQDLGGPSLRGSVEADAALRENLRVINEVIAECQKHLKQYPQDTLAREYLASAYRQKAELLAAILDSGRSEQ